MVRRLILWILQSKIYQYTIEKIVPKIHIWPVKTLDKYDAMDAMDILEPGDVIFSKNSGKLSSFLVSGLTKGKPSHAAVILNHDGLICEMISTGFHFIQIEKFFKESTRVWICRINADHKYRFNVADKCFDYIGADYDKQFVMGIRALSCSELVYYADYEQKIGASLEDFAGLGREYISPMGLLKAPGLSVVYDSNEQS